MRDRSAAGSGAQARGRAERAQLNIPLLERVHAAPHGALALGVLAVAAYLCLVNLDYAALWHDEAPAGATWKA